MAYQSGTLSVCSGTRVLPGANNPPWPKETYMSNALSKHQRVQSTPSFAGDHGMSIQGIAPLFQASWLAVESKKFQGSCSKGPAVIGGNDGAQTGLRRL